MPGTFDDLAAACRWVAWRNEQRGKRLTKIPYGVAGKPAKADDPSTWLMRADAEALHHRIANGQLGGIGCELGAYTEDFAIGGVDLDTCRAADGRIEPWAQEVIDRFGSYAEISPSETGAKIFFYYAELDALRKLLGDRDGRQFKRGGGDHPPGIEIYINRRYFAVTERPLAGVSNEIRLVSYETLRWLVEEAGPAFQGGKQAKDRSAIAFRKGAALRRRGFTFEQMVDALRQDPDTADWAREKGEANNQREYHRIWDKAAQQAPRQSNWYSKCLIGHDGRTLCNLSNTLLALREDPAWQDAFTHDEILATALLKGQPITDEDITRVQEWLQLAGLPSVAENTVRAAIELVAREHGFHPVKQYLETLAWDGVERLDDWLTDCLGVEKTEYAMAVGRMFLIGMVARIYRPGCQADYMLILEGPQQGRQKSSACRVLTGQWFSDNLPVNVASKDAALHLRGKWLVEIPELHTFGRSETAVLKAFITRREDNFRPPYGHREVYQPRQCLFIGTTNEQVYLTDPTGGRRFWPVATSDIDLDLLAGMRDRLFAEALARFRRGEAWWPNHDFEAAHIVPEQENRFDADVWEEPIAEHLAAQQKTTVYKIAKDALFLTTDKIDTLDQRRIIKVLQHLGWRRGNRVKGIRQWCR
jgi:hypothetical protein